MRTLVCAMSVLAVAVTALLTPPRAAACTCVAVPFYHSDPADGDSDVALNQALAIEGVFEPSSIRLEDESGNAIEFELNAGPWSGCAGTSADVIPRAPLAPNTRYTLRVDPLYPQAFDLTASPSLSFTTGTETLPDTALEPPASGQASVVFGGPEPMCGGGNVLTCLGIDETRDIELIVRRGQEVLMRTTTLVLDDGMYALPKVPDCVELRRRAPTGKRSAPRTICGDALNARPWIAGDNACHGGVIGTPTNGRDAGAPNAAGSSAPDAGAQSEESDAGSRANASDAYAERKKRGCAAAGGPDASGAGMFVLLLLSLFARRRCARLRAGERPPRSTNLLLTRLDRLGVGVATAASSCRGAASTRPRSRT